ncbi:MAG: arginase family protein [bacterium]
MKVFGAALDALPHPEKVALKRAYLRAAAENRLPEPDPADPYDALRPLLLEEKAFSVSDFIGKFEVDSAFTPKPAPEDFDRISSSSHFDFLDGNGCMKIARSLKSYVEKKVLPAMPAVMIGVDHCLSGGSIMALSESLGAADLSVLIFDAHFDAISSGARKAAFESIFGGVTQAECPDTYSCETFVRYLLDEEWILPENLIITGPCDYPADEIPSVSGDGIRQYYDEYRRFESKGITILPRDVLRESREPFKKALEGIKTKHLYVSLDLDVAASAENPAVRFHDSIGVSPGELFDMAGQIAVRQRNGKFILAGVDVMEMDVHLIDVRPRNGTQNRTLEIAVLFLKTLLADG